MVVAAALRGSSFGIPLPPGLDDVRDIEMWPLVQSFALERSHVEDREEEGGFFTMWYDAQGMTYEEADWFWHECKTPSNKRIAGTVMRELGFEGGRWEGLKTSLVYQPNVFHEYRTCSRSMRNGTPTFIRERGCHLPTRTPSMKRCHTSKYILFASRAMPSFVDVTKALLKVFGSMDALVVKGCVRRGSVALAHHMSAMRRVLDKVRSARHLCLSFFRSLPSNSRLDLRLQEVRMHRCNTTLLKKECARRVQYTRPYSRRKVPYDH